MMIQPSMVGLMVRGICSASLAPVRLAADPERLAADPERLAADPESPAPAPVSSSAS